jgi:hypothetical protein
MASLDWRIKGINGDQIVNEIATLRANSPTFRSLEQMAWNRGYRSVEVTMGSGLHKWSIAHSGQSSADRSVRQVRISSDATGTFGIGGRQITVAEIMAHELAHAVVPPGVAQPGKMDFRTNSPEELWARRQTGAVANDLSLPGPNNADFPITVVPVDREQACTFGNIQGNTPRDGVLFLDGSRGSNGIGASVPGRSGSIDPGFNPIANSDPPPVGFGNLAGLGSAMPWSAAHQEPLSDPLIDWLQLALAGNGAGFLGGVPSDRIPQSGQIQGLGAALSPFPQPQTTPQQSPPPGWIDPVPRFDPSAFGFGNFAGFGPEGPLSASHPSSGPASLSDWLQLALAGNGAGLLAGVLPNWTPQPSPTQSIGTSPPTTFPQPQMTPQQTPPPAPCRSRISFPRR